ncbi:Retrovirus-related Pol polyprotein from type-1 retrotransposable element R2 [Aphis craccivora]|uniref:Retrovirus-related Pol polyprotein from type-1 retrotransposable element R2 n=1 Tax=Aphis craccivora TaxID=307492 RepID=A0A6G0ZPN7_APHCR|nr:Retrovirus-related Pol polyprotein from type-1 retrotransposable element R2 [Aphis craccivora]
MVVMKEFKNLRVTLNNKNIMHDEINVRLKPAANRCYRCCYFAIRNLLKSKTISKKCLRKTEENLTCMCHLVQN